MPATMGKSVWLVLAALATIAGCGGSERSAVSGKVLLDSQPVEEGTISFVPTGKSTGQPVWGKIQSGSYAIPAKEGPSNGAYRVEIRWPRKTGKKLPALAPFPESDEHVEAIPTRFNSESELTAEIKPGNNLLDFELKSK